MRNFTVSFLTLFIFVGCVVAQWLPQAEQGRLHKLWPASLDKPDGLRWYKPATVTQNITITNGADLNLTYRSGKDDVGSNFHRVNPNRIFPWAVSGGLHNSTGWQSHVGVALPKGKPIVAYWSKVEAGARRLLPQAKWDFPDGTVFADMLVSDGATFEVRTREKAAGKWVYKTAYKSETLPARYTGPGRRCVECHGFASEGQGYGSRIRGSDETFSFPVIAERDGQRTAFDAELFEQGLVKGWEAK